MTNATGNTNTATTANLVHHPRYVRLSDDDPETFIYALLDVDGTPRYVGKTMTPRKRLTEHWFSRHGRHGNGQTAVARWLATLVEPPVMEILQVTTRATATEAERHWIRTLTTEHGQDVILNDRLTGQPAAEARTPSRQPAIRVTIQDLIPAR